MTSRLIDDLPGNVRFWLSEVGSRIDAGKNGGRRRNTVISQEAEVRYLVSTLAPSRRQIDRVYYYALCAPADRSDDLTTFDSALLGDSATTLGTTPVPPDLGPCATRPTRPAYDVYQSKTGGPPRP